MKTHFISFILMSANPAIAWGTVGHATIATIANNFLTSDASAFVSSILGSSTSMASVASWADDYRYTAAGAFSAPFHYIDAEDKPPSSCGVELSRDCGIKGCVVSAIANYTARLNGGVTAATQKKQAMEFLIHFLGDITQPLHTEAEEVGGNDIDVLWDGMNTNLHHIWDTEMVEKAAGGSSATVYTKWANTLTTDIKTGVYASERSSWVECADITTASECALAWATDSNALNCQYVLKVNETGKELSGTYYTNAVPYIELQIAKGGYRLATWLNAIAVAA